MIFFLGFFFQSDRPTQYQETHSTVNKKKGMALSRNNSHAINQRSEFSIITYAIILMLVILAYLFSSILLSIVVVPCPSLVSVCRLFMKHSITDIQE